MPRQTVFLNYKPKHKLLVSPNSNRHINTELRRDACYPGELLKSYVGSQNVGPSFFETYTYQFELTDYEKENLDSIGLRKLLMLT